jgi:alkylation response protein AidB-like acyl-CoA dehydrogenase
MAKMGLWSSPMAEVTFDDCHLPPESLISRPGAGMAVFTHSMDWERSCILAPSVGSMQRQVERAVEYAKTREQFGKPVGSFQAVANRIVDMAVRAEAARLLLYKTAWMRANGQRADLEGSIVKLFVSESWTESSIDQLLVHGGAGYMIETGVERDIRDAMGSRIYSGTNDIQRNLVARSLGLPAS